MYYISEIFLIELFYTSNSLYKKASMCSKKYLCNEQLLFRFGLVSLFHGISTLLEYLMPKLIFFKNGSDTI